MSQPTPLTFEEIGAESAKTITLTSGRMVEIWQDGDVFARLLDSHGRPIGSVVTVNTVTAGDQGWDIGRIAAPLQGGGFVIVWADTINFASEPSAVKARRFDADGVAIGDEIIVASAQSLYYDFSVTGLSGGGFMVSWDTFDGSATNSWARAYDSAGAASGAAFALPLGQDGEELYPAVATMTNGNVAFGYAELGNSSVGVMSAAGVLVAGSDTTLADARVADIAALAGGGFVVLYDDTTPADPSRPIVAQRFDAAGELVGGPIIVPGGGGIEVYNGKVIGLPDGGFFVAWQQDTTVQGARYTSAGASYGGQFEIGVDLQPDLRSVGLTADGRIAVTYVYVSESLVDTSVVETFEIRSAGVVLNGFAGVDDWLGSAFADTMNGDAGADILDGAAGNDILNGGLGADVMRGGAGNDLMYVDNASDSATEDVDAGVDTIVASRSWAVGSNIEKVTLSGAGDFNVAGNGLANTLKGNSGDNWINGSFGKDVLTGGGGRDSFIFNRTLGANNVDTITDYDVVRDVIRIDNAVFAGIGAAGALAAGAFNTGASATQADDRIIYDQTTGKLFFDIDGTGAAAQVHFATLSTKPTGMTASEFIII